MRTVLLIDDDPDALMLLDLAAKRCGKFEGITLAKDGQHALEIINRILRTNEGVLPDLIVTDLRMPFVDGAELTQLLKASRRTEEIPVYIVTTSDLPEDERRSREAGCAGFMLKQVSIARTAEWLRGIVEASGPVPAAT